MAIIGTAIAALLDYIIVIHITPPCTLYDCIADTVCRKLFATGSAVVFGVIICTYTYIVGCYGILRI